MPERSSPQLPSLLHNRAAGEHKEGASPAALRTPENRSPGAGGGAEAASTPGRSPVPSWGGSPDVCLGDAQTPGAAPLPFDALCPEVAHGEFFVNVALDGEDRSQHAAAAAKARGRLKLGRLGSMLGGVVSQVAGKSAAFDKVISETIKGAVEEELVEALRRRRWWAHVTPVMLPPMPGKTEWNTYVSLGDKGHFMVFRVEIVGTLPDEEAPAHSAGLLESLQCLFAICSTPQVQDEEDMQHARLSREIASIPHEVTTALQERKHPINARVLVADAAEEYRVFHELNWSRERASQAVISSRHTASSPMAVA